MKTTYHGTFLHRDLREAKVDLYLTDKPKYDKHAHETKLSLNGVVAWTVVEGGEEADEIERTLDLVDDNHEYLVIDYEDGHSETYRNSYAILFIF